MPSATTTRRSSGNKRRLSSLWFRFIPTCVWPEISMRMGKDNVESVCQLAIDT